jgi:hypothetical protein
MDDEPMEFYVAGRGSTRLRLLLYQQSPPIKPSSVVDFPVRPIFRRRQSQQTIEIIQNNLRMLIARPTASAGWQTARFGTCHRTRMPDAVRPSLRLIVLCTPWQGIVHVLNGSCFAAIGFETACVSPPYNSRSGATSASAGRRDG